MLKLLLFLNDINEKTQQLASEILSQFNFIIGIYTLEPILSEFRPRKRVFSMLHMLKTETTHEGVTSS